MRRTSGTTSGATTSGGSSCASSSSASVDGFGDKPGSMAAVRTPSYCRGPMSPRRRNRIVHFPASSRGASFLLLLAWFASLLLPAIHFEAEEELESGHACSGLFAKESSAPSIDASCPDGDGCTNPWHHHHSDSHHDA